MLILSEVLACYINKQGMCRIYMFREERDISIKLTLLSTQDPVPVYKQARDWKRAAVNHFVHKHDKLHLFHSLRHYHCKREPYELHTAFQTRISKCSANIDLPSSFLINSLSTRRQPFFNKEWNY